MIEFWLGKKPCTSGKKMNFLAVSIPPGKRLQQTENNPIYAISSYLTSHLFGGQGGGYHLYTLKNVDFFIEA
jgi:hypothetical protein